MISQTVIGKPTDVSKKTVDEIVSKWTKFEEDSNKSHTFTTIAVVMEIRSTPKSAGIWMVIHLIRLNLF